MKWLKNLFGPAMSPEEQRQLEIYQDFRALGRQLNLELIRQLPPPALPDAGKKLGLSKAGTLILNQEDEIAIAYDYCLQHFRRQGKNVIDRAMDAQPKEPPEDHRAYWNALLNARFSIFLIEAILPHRGARLRDLVLDEVLEVMDLGLSSTGTEGILIVGRILFFPSFNMSSGTFIPVAPEIFETKIKEVIEKFQKDAPTSQRVLSSAQSAAFEAQVLRIALHEGGEDNSFFTDMEA